MCGIGLAGISRPAAFLFCTCSLVILPRGVRGVRDLCWPCIPMPRARQAGVRHQLARVEEWWVTTMMARESLGGDLLPSQRIGPAGSAACCNRWAAVARSGSAALQSTYSRI